MDAMASGWRLGGCSYLSQIERVNTREDGDGRIPVWIEWIL